MTSGFRGDPSRLRPPSEHFRCRERIVEDQDNFDHLAVVAFECSVGHQEGKENVLLFYCREPSCGVLVDNEPAAEKEEDGAVDPSFFDPGYTLAGKTGFQVWPGSRLVVEALTVPQSSDPDDLQKWQQRVSKGAFRVLELGSGVGMVGASLAHAGCQVLLTDLSTLVSESLIPNLERNSISSSSGEEDAPPPEWMTTYLPALPTSTADDSSSSDTSKTTLRIGQGWVAAAALDWTRPLDNQLSNEQCQVDLIVASDCVWLVSMLEGLLDTVQSIFETSKRSPTLLMSFQRRDPDKPEETNTSKMFTTVDRVMEELKAQEWAVECLVWHPVVYHEEDGKRDDSKEVFLLQVNPHQ
ncbi:Putative methyltransferase [Seminavis robusta]|uniref:Methyltransferase n=1 Tax=Seminavis robusta TaxID=568900 RepID=A0A9N8DKP3_9STRA|nr:Putative methyltransferase [Seminavis robusta]|eukprot:Sro195_g083240.1 Putative methyltransferase (354) ;mRNA; r:65075-66136